MKPPATPPMTPPAAQAPTPPTAGPRPARILLACTAALTLLVLIALVSIARGAVSLSLSDVVDGLTGGSNAFIVQEYRLPRVLVAILAGGALAIAGVFLQAAMRNPLASPDVVGLSKGGGVGATVAVMLASPASQVWAVPLGVLAGTTLTAAALLVISRRIGASTVTLVLVGAALAALAGAAIEYLLVREPQSADQALVWLAGSVYGSDRSDVTALLVWLAVCLPLVVVATRAADLAGFGDDSIVSLGGHPVRVRATLIIAAVLLTAGAVTSVGGIGFLGLLAPHLARFAVGSRARHLVPMSAVTGALILCLADFVGRVVALPNEIPAGIVAVVVGGPYLLFLLIRETRKHA
ncbi:Fe(3+)-citrate import system permease protein YfmE [Planotetraspora thailandica]|uniref:Fe(3+)-citrate import system permease protein YfmE n=1 Tax=Planotetraspora thailandica TaxID=487172 RepID=A0A8J3VFT0_9ACTN|nr:iron chelate uptake ABC transporter family permease subunit [Planotetraspora thailandica]GII57765.1 Fe(3+)-citrate import system permease protein YfmE [Planotetraspora thailandica]